MTLFTLVLFLFLLSLLLIFFLYRRLHLLQQQLKEVQFSYRSSNVKHGQHWEQFVPFMDAFGKIAQRENFVFIGMPIDGISFDDDGVKFIEIKTGKSQLNQKQKQVKKLIEGKQVEWIELRF